MQIQHTVKLEVTLLRTATDASGRVQFVVADPDNAESGLTMFSNEVDAVTVEVPFAVTRTLTNAILQSTNWGSKQEYNWDILDSSLVLRVTEGDHTGMFPSPANVKDPDLFEGQITHVMVVSAIKRLLHGIVPIDEKELVSIRKAVLRNDSAFIDAHAINSIVQIAALGDLFCN